MAENEEPELKSQSLADGLVNMKLWVRNARMVNARRELGLTQVQVSWMTQINKDRIGQIENLRVIPTDNEKDDLSGVLMKPVEYLFPESLLSAIKSGMFDVRERGLIETEVMALESGMKKRLIQAALTYHDELPDFSLRKVVKECLSTLTLGERKVIEMRFGLEDGRSHTQEEVGAEFNVTRERIRQIEAKALRKLRHPSRSRKLKEFINGIYMET